MRPSTVRTWVGGFATGALLIGSLVRCTGTAHADAAQDYEALYGSAVCMTLDDYPSVSGMLGIMQSIVEDGLTEYQAGEVVGIAVHDRCPEYTGLARKFVARYSKSSVA